MEIDYAICISNDLGLGDLFSLGQAKQSVLRR